jgi:hypothetical protein
MIQFHDRRTGQITNLSHQQAWYDVEEAVSPIRANNTRMLTGERIPAQTYNVLPDDEVSMKRYVEKQKAVNASPDGTMQFSPSVANYYEGEKIDTSYGFTRSALNKKANELERDAQLKGK